MRVNFVCVRVGTKYGPEYVEVLRDMVLRHSTEMEHECAFWCLTDAPDELPQGIYPIAADPSLPGWWAKVQLFSPDMPWEAGDRIAYFDLDVCITGRLEDLVETPGITRDHGWPCYNSSVMVWTAGDHADVWDRFTVAEITKPAEPPFDKLIPNGEINGGDQVYLTNVGGWQTFPEAWCRSWRWEVKDKGWPPEHCKVVIFHGSEKPAEVTTGWVPNIWKVGGFQAFPIVKGVNTSEEARLDNVRSAVNRDLEWFTGFRDEGKTCVIVCGAPSMKASLPEIKAQRRRGARIVSVNAAWRFLAENGVVPDVNVMLDARPGNVDLVAGAPKSMRFLVASQCHPSLFDALSEHEVVVWHNAWDGGNEALREILAPWWDEGPDQRPCILIPGGSTVGLRSLWLAAFSGFRTIHLYGIDSSYADDGTHHAYPQALNDAEQVVKVVRGSKEYGCSAWMVRQTAEFSETWNDLRNYVDPETGQPAPVTVHVHGTGLLPDVARDLRKEARALA